MARATSTTDSQQTALDRDARGLHEAVADLVRVYQFRDRDRICCHDVSVTQCYALETIVEHGPLAPPGVGGPAVPGQEHHQPRRQHPGSEGIRRAARGRQGWSRHNLECHAAGSTALRAHHGRSRRPAEAALTGSRSRCPCGRGAGAPSPRARGGCQVPIRSRRVTLAPRAARRRSGLRMRLTLFLSQIVVTNNHREGASDVRHTRSGCRP